MTRAAILFAIAALLAGCVTDQPQPREPVVMPETNPVIDGQASKDETVTDAAARVDAVVAKDAPQIVQPVKEQTDRIREAVAANPAADVKRLADQFTEALATLREQLAAADTRAAKLDGIISRMRSAEQRSQAVWFRGVALGAMVLAGLLGWARQIQLAAAAALGAILCLGLAQLVSQSWFMPACAVAVGAILIGFGWAAVHAYRKHELAGKVEKEAAKLKDTLTRVVPAVDSVIEEVGDAGSALKAKLRAAMTGADGAKAKATIHEIRAASKLTEAVKANTSGTP